MDPNNQPWTPRPYEPEVPHQDNNQSDQPAQQPPVQPWQPQPWQPGQPATPPQPTHSEPVEQQPAQPVPPMPTQPVQPTQPQPVWNNPHPPVQHPQSTSTQPFGSPQQFGGPMAELPPLASADQLNAPTAADKKQRLIMWIVVALAVIIPALIIGLTFWAKSASDNKQAKINQATAKVTYNSAELQQLAKGKVTDAQVAKLDKTATFYTMLKAAAVKPVINTKWDVYFTGGQTDKRGDQYTFYDTTIDYRDKSYSYSENAYSNLGVFQTRCIGDKQYNFNDSKMVSGPTWQASSDSTDCALSTVVMHLNDGLNAGGLTSDQADTFLGKLQQSGVLKVNSLALTTNKDKQYLKVDANITPQDQGNGVYWGMQRFMNAFQATGLDASKQPYTFFGASGEGAHVVYYIDAATQLPVYSVIESTPSYDKFGKPQVTTTWSHRFVEYAYPEKVLAGNLNDHAPITFTNWPDH